MFSSFFGPLAVSSLALAMMILVDPHLQQWRHVVSKILHRLLH